MCADQLNRIHARAESNEAEAAAIAADAIQRSASQPQTGLALAAYFVHCPQRGPWTRPHSTQPEAETEARRLAAKHPGFEFFVVQPLSSFIVPDPVKVTRFHDGVPF